MFNAKVTLMQNLYNNDDLWSLMHKNKQKLFKPGKNVGYAKYNINKGHLILVFYVIMGRIVLG
jgi:hypothetical protein